MTQLPRNGVVRNGVVVRVPQPHRLFTCPNCLERVRSLARHQRRNCRSLPADSLKPLNQFRSENLEKEKHRIKEKSGVRAIS
jgi:hypothetical protein